MRACHLVREEKENVFETNYTKRFNEKGLQKRPDSSQDRG